MGNFRQSVVCDTAKVRVFKQITTVFVTSVQNGLLFAILQKYEFSSKSQHLSATIRSYSCCLRYCKSTSFQANHNTDEGNVLSSSLFAILQKYEFSSKSQHSLSTNFHNWVVCDTAKVRVFKQITTDNLTFRTSGWLFAILQKYEFSSKSQLTLKRISLRFVVCDTAKVRVFKQITTTPRSHHRFCRCLRYCKSTSFQANHN